MDLTDFLTPEELRHYERFLGEARVVHFVHPAAGQNWTWTATAVQDDQPAPDRYGRIAELEKRPTRDGILVRNGWGPDVASSSQELAPSPGICWDVCHYYRRLGLHWKAAKAQIRRRLRQLGALRLEGREALIYAASQLLDDDKRRRYDRVPLGQLFLEDRDTEEMLKRAAHNAASAMAARGFPTTPEDVLGEWGLKATPRGGPGGEGREGYAQLPPPPPRTGPSMLRWGLEWSWYADPDAEYLWVSGRAWQLESWQLMLVRAFAARGMKVRFAVGLGLSDGFEIRAAPDQRILVVLLGRGEPTQEMAEDAAEQWGPARQIPS